MRARPPLAGAVGTILPGSGRTELVRSAVWPGERGRKAFLAWQDSAPRPTARIADDRRGGRLLAPLICAALGSDTGGMDPRLMTYLRTARVREELRSAEYRRICAELISALAGSIPFVLVGGVALAETVYPKPELRHSHGVSILIAERNRRGVAAAIGGAGFRAVDGSGEAGITIHAVHETGLPLWVRSGLVPFPAWDGAVDRMREEAMERTILGARVHVLAPADRMFHVLVRAAAGTRRQTLLWACDAWHLVEREPNLDWDRLVERVARVDAALPAWVFARYLARRLEAEIPENALDGLAEAARRTGTVGRELALFGAAMRPGPKLAPFVRRAGSWRERLDVMRWRFAPSPRALVAAGRVGRVSSAPRFYFARPFRSLVRFAGNLVSGRRRASTR